MNEKFIVIQQTVGNTSTTKDNIDIGFIMRVVWAASKEEAIGKFVKEQG